MFNWFKRKPKKVQVLVVVNDDLFDPVDYYNKVDTDFKAEIRSACNYLAISYTEQLIDRIADTLFHGYAYRVEDYGFELLTIEV